MDYEEQVALCALNKIFGYHPRLAMALIEETGSAAAVFSAPDLEVPGHPELAERVEPAMLDWAEGELTRIRERGFRFLAYKDSDYPAPLLEIPDPPLGIYLNGSTPPTQIFDLHPMVGVVGTRDLSPYGRDVYALPGRVDDIRSAGCNSLIHQNMAEIITTPEDLVARLGLGAPSRKAAVIGPNVFADALERQFGAGSIERAVGRGVQKNRGVTVEELSALMRQPFAATMTAVSTLEAAGFVRMDLLRRCSLAPEWE